MADTPARPSEGYGDFGGVRLTPEQEIEGPSLDHRRRWRVGEHYSIHVYEGDRPVATFLTVMDAAQAVDAFNDAQRVARMSEVVEATRAWMNEVLEHASYADAPLSPMEQPIFAALAKLDTEGG